MHTWQQLHLHDRRRVTQEQSGRATTEHASACKIDATVESTTAPMDLTRLDVTVTIQKLIEIRISIFNFVVKILWIFSK